MKEYVGCGPEAERRALDIDRRRQACEAARRAVLEEQFRYAEADAALALLFAECRTIFRAALVAVGCYCHHGIWRRRRRG
jgi:hypothetical protein